MRFRRRLLLLYVVFCVALAVIWLRTTQLQFIDGDAWAATARAMRQHTERLEARRGPIVSADGVTLAHDKPVFQLAVVGWHWQRRGRARCSGCGLVYFEQGKRKYFPRGCSCERYERRGAAPGLRDDAYPRDAGEGDRARLERLPDGDLGGLEKALALAPGELAQRAEKRIAEITRLVAATKTRWEKAGDHSSFRKKRLEMIEQDLLLRPYVIVARVPEDVARFVLTSEDGRYRGLKIQIALRRHYPQGDFAPRLLGWTSQIYDRPEYERLCKEHGEHTITLSSPVGRRGIEKAYNWQLHGMPGLRVSELDGQGAFTKIVEDRAPRPGRTAHLSVDLEVSRAAEAILEDHGRRNDGYLPGGKPSGAFVAMDVQTGEILIWAEAPRFDLNEDLDKLYDPDAPVAVADTVLRVWQPRDPLEPHLDLETWRSELVLPVPITFSRIGQIAVEPGSTMKPLMALAMLSSGRPLPFGNFHCSGVNPACHPHADVGLEGAICVSCNRYFALSLRDSRYWPVYRRHVGAFIDAVGLGHRPTSEIREWAPGQWLWPWVDFELKTAVAHAQARLAATLHERAPVLELAVQPGAPATLGGDAKRLGRRLAGVAAYVTRHTGAARVRLSVARKRVDGRKVIMEFGLRAAGRPAWFTLPGAAVARPLPDVLARFASDNAGVAGHVERGGTVWFKAAFERRTGRTDPNEPPRIRDEDGRNVAIGQGPVLVTPLHMVRAMAMIANGGTLVEPHAVRAVGTQATSFQRRRVPIDAAHLRRVRDGMYDVANARPGTADHCRFDELPAEVYGKTGTAQVGGTWRPWEADEANGPWHHWFVGFAEGRGRTIAFACVLHARQEGGAGGTAAWAAKEILARWYASRGAGR